MIGDGAWLTCPVCRAAGSLALDVRLVSGGELTLGGVRCRFPATQLARLRCVRPGCRYTARVEEPTDSADAVGYLTAENVAERYGTTPAAVEFWRTSGLGPEGVQVGDRVLYPVAEIARWDCTFRGYEP